MANRTKTPMVEIEMDRPRHLCFDYNCLAELQDLGYDLDKIVIGELGGKGTLKVLRDVVWAGLVWEDPSLTVSQVGRLIGEVGALIVLEKVKEAHALANPPAPEAPASPPLAESRPVQ